MSTLPPALVDWLSDALGDPGPFLLTPISGGNSNETALLAGKAGEWILRRPPSTAISATANNLGREHRVLSALAATDVPAPTSVAFTDDPAIAPGGALVLERVPGHPLSDTWPAGWPEPARHAADVGYATVDALARLHLVDPEAVGMGDFGRPIGYLDRQVTRWRSQYEAHRVRDLPAFERVGEWLSAHQVEQASTGIVHGDFRMDNCLFVPGPARVAGIIDWELSTLGDPLVDLGLFLSFWGDDRADPIAMPHIQAVSRGVGAPSRERLAAAYGEITGRSVDTLPFYMVLALYKLAAIVEGAYAKLLSGDVDSPYARSLAEGVPDLLAEAERIAAAL